MWSVGRHRKGTSAEADDGGDGSGPGHGAPPLGRRSFLRATAGAGTAALAAGTVPSTVGAQAGPDYGGWFTGDARGGETENFDGTTVDRTGQDEVEVVVGAEGNGGTFAFEPPAVRISPGTTVNFVWESDTHNVLIEEQPDGADWQGHEPIEDTGFSFTHTFETEGIYKYYCEPHVAVGMKGAIVVGEGGAGGGEVGEPNFRGWFTSDERGGETDNYEHTIDRRGQDEVEVVVGAEGNGGTFAFGPASVRISPGTTVNFVWESNTHNILIEEQPEGADWQGHEPIEDTGFSYTHTFETEGIYKYYCQPHVQLGMKGAIVVGDIGGRPGGEEGGLTIEWTPGLIALASTLGVAVLSPIVFALFLSAKRESISAPEAGVGVGRRLVRATGPPETAESAVTEPAIELGHDDYDPLGTLALVALYFVVVALMWLFMYFVEFLGNGPTVVG